MKTPLFLGRTEFDVNTMTYHFSDGSGKVPEEMRQDLESAAMQRTSAGANGLFVLGCLFAWKDRLSAPKDAE